MTTTDQNDTLDPKRRRYELSFKDVLRDDDGSHTGESLEKFAKRDSKQRRDRTPR